MRRERGFTLIEVLVAMAIFGVVALTLMAHTQLQIRQAAGLEDRLLAHWVALNALTDMQVSPDFVPLGNSDNTAVLAGRDWFITEQVLSTPADNVHRVEIMVAPFNALTNAKGSNLVSLSGFVRQHVPPSQNTLNGTGSTSSSSTTQATK